MSSYTERQLAISDGKGFWHKIELFEFERIHRSVYLYETYETFKAMYDANPTLQGLVKNFNADGIQLNVPGVPDVEQPKQDGEDSQEKVNQTAAAAAEKNLSK
jgi:hypothetical protein